MRSGSWIEDWILGWWSGAWHGDLALDGGLGQRRMSGLGKEVWIWEGDLCTGWSSGPQSEVWVLGWVSVPQYGGLGPRYRSEPRRGVRVLGWRSGPRYGFLPTEKIHAKSVYPETGAAEDIPSTSGSLCSLLWGPKTILLFRPQHKGRAVLGAIWPHTDTQNSFHICKEAGVKPSVTLLACLCDGPNLGILSL